MKAAGIFILKCVTFTVIFWSLYFLDQAMGPGTSPACSTSSKQGDGQALMQKYWEQVAQADKLQATYLQQQRQATAQLEKQGELLSRWEKVIERWERATSEVAQMTAMGRQTARSFAD